MVSSVARKESGGIALPTRCAAPPSSTGAGILLQSTSRRFRWFIASLPPRLDRCAYAHAPGLSPRPHQAALLPAPVALLHRLALVVQLLALGERELQLGAAALVEVKLERDQGHAFAVDRADQLVDLLSVQQQLARPLGQMIEAVGLQIFGNIGVDEPDLAVPRIGIGFGDRALARADRLHLGAGQRKASFHRVLDRVVEPRFPVFRDDLDRSLVLLGHFKPFSTGPGFRSKALLRAKALAAQPAPPPHAASAGSWREPRQTARKR